MRLSYSSLVLMGLAAPSLAMPKRDTETPKGKPDAEKAEAIKDAYLLSWKGYYDHAFPNDTLRPVSNSYENDR